MKKTSFAIDMTGIVLLALVGFALPVLAYLNVVSFMVYACLSVALVGVTFGFVLWRVFLMQSE